MCVSLLASLALPSISGAAQAMDTYKWKYRPFVVFAPEGGDALLARQRQQVNSVRPAFIDRRIVVVYVTGDRIKTEFGPSPGISASALRERYGISPSAFRALLIGKDGDVKLSEAAPISSGTVFRTVDSMPMRQDEIRRSR